MRSGGVTIATLLGVSFLGGAVAQESAPPSTVDEKEQTSETEGSASDTIVVQGARQRGAVLGDIAPDTVLDEADIASYGVSSLSELLAQLEAETGSSRGRDGGGPVVLLNGRRISGFREIGRYPPEAIERVEILPEEAALKYGFKADQRVINFILKKNFSTRTAETRVSGPTAGGSVGSNYEAGRFSIDGPRRFNMSGEIEFSPPLLESERDILASPPSLPYDSVGNISAITLNAEIDPALSALAGETVTLAAVPAGLTDPEIADFVPVANNLAETDIAQFRTLRSEQEKIELDIGMARDINEAWGITLSAGLDISDTASLQGLGGVSLNIPETSSFNPFTEDITVYRYADELGALTRQTDQVSGNLSLTANRQTARWLTTITANARFSSTDTETDRRVDLGNLQDLVSAGDVTVNPYTTSLGTSFETDISETRTSNYDTTVVMTGPVMDLEAGEVRTTLTGEVSAQNIQSEDRISGVQNETDLSRETLVMRGNLDVPILFADSEDEWGVGDLNLNLNGAVDDLSDFGTLYTYGYGLNWRPRKQLRLIASVTEEDGAPSIAQLGNPRELTENARAYDYIRGETVFVTAATGGNPDLKADHRRVYKLGANWKPYEKTDLTFRMDYTDSLIEDPVGSIAAASAEIQAALPERFVRDTDGTLIFVDATPFNYVESQKRDLRSGFVYSRQIGKQPEGRPTGRGASRGGSGRRRSFPGRFRLSIFHTYTLEDRVLIREGIEELDLLGGSAIGSAGGRSEHELTVRANIYNKGIGLWTGWTWQSGTDVIDPDGNRSRDLSFSDIGRLNASLFLDLNQRHELIEKYSFLKDTRVSLYSSNIFDEKQTVRDGNGDVPLQYQPDLLDPTGRTVGLFLRKSF